MAAARFWAATKLGGPPSGQNRLLGRLLSDIIAPGRSSSSMYRPTLASNGIPTDNIPAANIPAQLFLQATGETL